MDHCKAYKNPLTPLVPGLCGPKDCHEQVTTDWTKAEIIATGNTAFVNKSNNINHPMCLKTDPGVFLIQIGVLVWLSQIVASLLYLRVLNLPSSQRAQVTI